MRQATCALTLTLLATSTVAAEPGWAIGAFGLGRHTHLSSTATDVVGGEEWDSGYLLHSSTGFGGGLLLERTVGARWAVRLAPAVAPRGFQHYHRSALDVDFQYLELPVLLKWTALGGKSAALHAFAGPYAGYRVTDTQTDIGITFLDLGVSYHQRAENWSKWDAGLTAGLGAELRVGRGGFFVDASYSHGLKDIYTDPLDTTLAFHFADHWRALEVRAGIAVRLGSTR